MNIPFEKILADQQLELANYSSVNWCSRKEEARVDLDSPLAQIVVGVRRSGKSTMCHKILMQQNVSYAYANFDDERLYGLKSEQLNDLLEALYIVYGDFKYLFLDEIQNVDAWHLFVNRLLRQGIRMLITGSNAKLLSSELSTHLTGRYIQIELFPFSFVEYLQYKKLLVRPLTTKDTAFRKQAYNEYLQQGGFPELFATPKQKAVYIQTLFQAIVYKDILQRFSVKYVKALGDIANWLLNNFAREINYAKLSKLVGIKGIQTVQNYVSYLEQAYLFVSLGKFSYKSIERVRNRKAYVIDPAFVSFADGSIGSAAGWLLENIVFLELMRRRNDDIFDLFFYKSTYEIDFVLARNGKPIELIQVSLVLDNARTRTREISALLKAADELKCDKLTLITETEREIICEDNKTIEIVPIIDWLCGTL